MSVILTPYYYTFAKKIKRIMLIQKFGGTSVGSPQRMRELSSIIGQDQKPKIVVLSAVAGTTNKLVSISTSLGLKNIEDAIQKTDALNEEYIAFVNELLPNQDVNERGMMVVDRAFSLLRAMASEAFTDAQGKIILAQGELISTNLYHLYLSSVGIPSVLLSALDFMRTDVHGEPDLLSTRNLLLPIVDGLSDKSYIITQGYICRNANGGIDNLQRGGSDYTATILGAVLKADEVQIWTDIDGMHNNDPRIVQNTQPVRKISYREASELAYFGAKILHPTCILPTEKEDVPVRLKYTFDPSAPGTFISKESSGKTITAIAAKDNVTYVRITSGRMLNAYGFLRKVFEVFEKYQTSIDMITTSEVAVSMSIDNDYRLSEIVEELAQFGEIFFEKGQSIICIVGDKIGSQVGVFSSVLQAFQDIPVNMISYGGSKNNISVLIDSTYKENSLRSLQHVLFTQAIGADV
jgi:aspartate kinase